MNAAIASPLGTAGASARGVNGLAIRIGRALEAWGRRRSLRVPDREQLTLRLAAAAEAAAARRDNDSSVLLGTYAPLR
ncbi:hypothetical protein WDJ51_01415 [Rathayibacter sp. YIM 133350]|uniref:hypothetical protein n=1 Tax=Rathayibacter sp. YIM 133350 TaxID=3131992 RepID=UPI00307EC47A